MSDNTATQEGSEQPNDLLKYIGQSGFQAVTDDELVEQMSSEAPVTVTDGDVGQNDDQAASSKATAQGVTTPPQGNEESTTPPGTEASQEPTNDEALRLQQRVEQLERGLQQRDAALGLLADQARKREEDLFNRSLELMTPEEQEQAKAARRVEQLEAENELYRTTDAQRREAQERTQERLDKIEVVQKVATKLGLPLDDQFVAAALMESQSPAELFATARRMAMRFQAQEQAAQAEQVQQVAQSNVHAAGGETAPTTPPKKVEQRSGKLIEMMQERQYTSEEIR